MFLLVIVFTTAARKQIRTVTMWCWGQDQARCTLGKRSPAAAQHPEPCVLSLNLIALETFLKHQFLTLSISSMAYLPFFLLIDSFYINFFFLCAYSIISLKFMPWIFTNLECCQKWKVSICFKLY